MLAGVALAQDSNVYRVGAGDVIDIQVFQEDTLSNSYTIGDDGSSEMPLLGRVDADGHSVQELSDHLVDLLGASYLVDPQVSVRVEEYNSQPVRVLSLIHI